MQRPPHIQYTARATEQLGLPPGQVRSQPAPPAPHRAFLSPAELPKEEVAPQSVQRGSAAHRAAPGFTRSGGGRAGAAVPAILSTKILQCKGKAFGQIKIKITRGKVEILSTAAGNCEACLLKQGVLEHSLLLLPATKTSTKDS